MPRIKKGDKIPCFLTVIREANTGEKMLDNDGKLVEINNDRRNKFWAVVNNQKGPEILCCSDGL